MVNMKASVGNKSNSPMNTKSYSSSSPRHCMIVHAYYPKSETRVEREASALVARGYRVDVLCLRDDGDPAFENVDGVDVYRLPIKRHRGVGKAMQFLEYLAFFVLVVGKLLRLDRRRRYQVVQVHNLPDFLIFSAFFPKLRGAKLVLDLHDLMPEFFAASSKRVMTSVPVRLLVWQEQLACRFADHVITVTELWRETLIKRGVPAGKTSVVMNVADDRIFHRAQSSEPRSHVNGAFTIIYHGTLAQRYGIDVAIRAVETARERIPELRLIVHGSGEYQNELAALAAQLKLEQHVQFSRRSLSTMELADLIRTADVGIVPNRNDIFTDEILPTKLMEYVALGIPVIAARTRAIAAYFDETMVQFFDPGNVDDLANRIVSLHNNRARLADIIRSSDTFNQKHNWAAVAAGYGELVDKLRRGDM
jgi:glycosyltransferase involved in cell wall biosynthesis